MSSAVTGRSKKDIKKLSLHELYGRFDEAKRDLLKIRSEVTPHTKRFHLIKTNTGAAHIGLMLGPSWALGISEMQSAANSAADVSWWHQPFFLEFSVEGFISCLTYTLYLPVGIIDIYQRIHRKRALNKILQNQLYVLNLLEEINRRSQADSDYLETEKFERAFRKRLQLDVNRHNLQMTLNVFKILVAVAALTTQALKFMTVIESVNFFSVMSAGVGFPFIFAGLTLLANAVDLYYAARKLSLAYAELQHAELAYEMSKKSRVIPADGEAEDEYQLKLQLRVQQRRGAYDKAVERSKKRVKKVIYRTGLVLVALCVCLPVFSFPPLIAAIAGTLSLLAMLGYSWYQRGETRRKLAKAALAATCGANSCEAPAKTVTPGYATLRAATVAGKLAEGRQPLLSGERPSYSMG